MTARSLMEATCPRCNTTRMIWRYKARMNSFCKSCSRKNTYGFTSAIFTGRVIGRWKGQAKRRELEWALTDGDLDALWFKQGGRCAITGVELTLEALHEYTVSLDRIDSTKGYTLDNVQFVAAVINIMKNSSTQANFIFWCGLVVNHNTDYPSVSLENPMFDLGQNVPLSGFSKEFISFPRAGVSAISGLADTNSPAPI